MKYITLFAFLPFSYDYDDTESKISKIEMKISSITSYILISFPTKSIIIIIVYLSWID